MWTKQNTDDQHLRKELVKAIFDKNEEKACQLIYQGIDVCKKYDDKQGNKFHFLNLCIHFPNKIIIKHLLNQGVNPNELSDIHQLQLYYPIPNLRIWHIFALTGQIECVELFIEKCGSHLDLTTVEDYNVLHMLQPDRHPIIQDIYIKTANELQHKMEKSLGSNQIVMENLIIRLLEAKECEMKANRLNDKQAAQDKIFSILNGSTDEQIKLLGEFKYMNNSMNSMMLNFFRTLKTLRELFNGGNERHKAIACLIEQKLLNKKSLQQR
jgi:hypothetical protein